MAELSNHSYHYKSDLARLEEEEEDTSQSSSKKKTRRRKRMLTGVSKQRRAANERERKRLQIINMAYKELKGALPLFPNEDNISKIEIVKLAARTIQYLSELLNKSEDNEDDKNLNTDSMRQARSPGGSESSECSTDGGSSSDLTDIESSILNADNICDLSNLLMPIDDFKLEIESDENSSSSISDAFCGIDISSFLNVNDSPDDVFPSMLYL